MKKLIIFFACVISLSVPLGAQEEDEQLLNQLEEERKKTTASAVQMNDMTQNLKQQIVTIPEQLKNLGGNNLNAGSIMDEKFVQTLKTTLRQSPLKNLPKDEVRNLVLEKIQNEKFKNFVVNHPKILNTWIEILQDENALSSAVGIFLRKSDLKYYGVICLTLLIFSWLFKKIFFKKKWSFGYRLLMSFLVSLSVSVISFGVFYNMFYDELSPTVKIILKNWRNRNL
jgi:hypothetical protein